MGSRCTSRSCCTGMKPVSPRCPVSDGRQQGEQRCVNSGRLSRSAFRTQLLGQAGTVTPRLAICQPSQMLGELLHSAQSCSCLLSQ